MTCSHCADLVGLLGESHPYIHRDLLRDRHNLRDPLDTNMNLFCALGGQWSIVVISVRGIDSRYACGPSWAGQPPP
jgi:hypothetical protein